MVHSQRTRRQQRSGQQLVRALTDSPALPAVIPAMPAAGLKVLVDEIGLHDAGALIEHSTNAQLISLIDAAIWKPARPGMPETFDAQEFLQWLSALLEIGDEFAAQRLQALDEDLLVMAMMHYLRIVDLDKQILDASSNEVFSLWDSLADNKELYGPYEVGPRHEEDWEVLQPLLTALHIEARDFLQAILTRCCLPESLLRFRDADSAALDAAGDYRDRRESQGFVTSETAGNFLRTAAGTDPATLAQERDYDLDTQDYFKRAVRHALREAQQSGGSSTRRLTSQATVAERETLGPAPDDNDEVTATAAEIDALETLIAQVEFDALSANTLRIASAGSAETANSLQLGLERLATGNPETLGQRMNEAAYLANLLMSGTQLGQSGLTHKQAVAAVMATCNLGYEFHPAADLAQMPGLIGLFRIGWHLLQRVPAMVIAGIRRTLQQDRFTARLGARRWIAQDLLRALDEELRTDVTAGGQNAIQDILQLLELIFDDHAVEHLQRLVSELPMTVEASDGIRIYQRRRFIECEADIREIEQFLADLATQVRSEHD